MTDKQHLDLFGQMMLQRAAALSVLAMLDKWYEEHGQKIAAGDAAALHSRRDHDGPRASRHSQGAAR